MPTKNVKPLDDVQTMLSAMIMTDLERQVQTAQAQANARYQPLRTALGVPDGVTLDISPTPDGKAIATWDTPDERKLALVGDIGSDIGSDGVSTSAEVTK